MKNYQKCLLVLSVLGQIAWATPSGLGTLSPNIKLPTINGRTVPVQLLPHLNDHKVVYVKPLEGQFVSQGVVKSPITSCDLVKQELKISEINVEARLQLANIYKQAQLEHQRNQDAYKKLVKDYERLTAMAEPYRGIVTQAEKDKTEVFNDIKAIKEEIGSIRELITIEEDPEKIESMQKQIESLETDMKQKKREFVMASKELREARKNLTGLEIDLAEVTGKKSGMEKTLVVQMDELTDIQVKLNDLSAASDQVLKRYSERIGGYTTFTSEFAPSSYIAALQQANPGYQFLYVPSVTAVVDATIPDNIEPGSPLEARIGTLILDAKWSDPQRAREKKPFTKYLIAANETVKDPVKLSQNRMAELESSLEGTKFLSLKLSILGYCALKEPTTLNSQFVGGAADTFKVAMYYTYPVNYAIRLTGQYNAYASLYELYKKSSSSSWFGLKKSQKQKYVRDMSSSKWIKVKVEPLGAQLTPQESLILTDKIKEQLVAFTIKPYLEKDGLPKTAPAPALGELGATTVSKQLMMIPNPYTFWGGVVLGGLSKMFGSSSSESVTQITEQSWLSLNYEAGFSMLHSGDITIGDLKRAPVTTGRGEE